MGSQIESRRAADAISRIEIDCVGSDQAATMDFASPCRYSGRERYSPAVCGDRVRKDDVLARGERYIAGRRDRVRHADAPHVGDADVARCRRDRGEALRHARVGGQTGLGDQRACRARDQPGTCDAAGRGEIDIAVVEARVDGRVDRDSAAAGGRQRDGGGGARIAHAGAANRDPATCVGKSDHAPAGAGRRAGRRNVVECGRTATRLVEGDQRAARVRLSG